MLGALEAIIHWQKNKRKQHLHHLNEKEHATLADTSTRTETPKALVGTMFCEAFSVNHFVHGSEKEDIWSFVNGDEGRFKTLLDLPENCESLEDKIMAVAKVLKLKAGAKEVEQVANALGEIRQLVHAPGFQQEIKDSLHDDSNIPSLTAGDIAEATDEQYQNGERHLHSEFQDSRLRHQVRQYFHTEKFMDHVAVTFVFVYSQVCGVLYAVYLHQVHIWENEWIATPIVEPPLLRILLARSQAMALIIVTTLMVLLLTRGVCTRLRAFVGWSTVLSAIIDKHVLVHRSCGYMLVLDSFLHCFGHLLQTKIDLFQGAALTYDFWGHAAITGYILWAIIIAFCSLSSNYVRRKAFEWFFYPHLLLIILWAVFLVAHGGLQWFGFGLPLACISVIPAVLVYFVERYFHVSWGSDETIHIARATVTDKMVMVTVDIGNSNLSYETGQYSMLKVPDLAVHEWHPFTIASGGGQKQFDLLIAVAGDWTQKLHDVLEDAQQKHDAMVNASTNRENAVHSKPAYPKICVRGGYGAPAEGMQGKSYVVMVGGGVGATPFLSFLSAACNAAQMHENVIFPGLKSAVFFWVSRDPQDFRWVNTYSSIIAKNPSLARRIQIKLCLTKTLESIATEDVSKEAVSLFWLGIQRAMRNQNKNKELAAMLGVPTQFGRPDWDQEFRHISNKLQKSEDMMMDERFEISVFACGNPMLTESLEKACAANTDKNVKMRLYAEEF
jgi:predicted ferric reductase